MSIMLVALLALAPSGEAVHGTVLDAITDEPIAGATVQLIELQRGTLTDAEGRFRFDDVPAGPHTLVVRFVGYRSAERSVEAPGAPLLITLEPELVRIDEVVVTGSPIGSAVRYQAVQAFSRGDLERRAAASLGEMLDGSPGLAMRSMGPAPARPVIRGFDGDRVVVLENGERSGDLSETAADHALALDPLTADRVEVLRGPASLLYGSGAIGGVVNVLTDDIPENWETGWAGDVALQSSTVNRQAGAYGRVRYGTDDWLLGARLAARGAGDVRTPEGILPDTDLRNVDAALSGAFQHGTLHGGVTASALSRTYGLPESIEEPDERIEIRMQRQSVHARGVFERDAFFDAIELRLHAGRYAHDEIEIVDGDEDLELAFDQRVVSTTLIGRHRAVGPMVRGAVGLSLYARDLLVGGQEALTPDGRAWRLATFVFEEAALAPKLSAQVAVRGELELTAIRPNALFPGAHDKGRTASLSGAMGLNLRPAPDVEIGLQVAQAFRSPAIEERYSDAPHVGAGAYEIGDPDLGLERALGTDLFVRWVTPGLSLEAAAFGMRIADFVVYQPTGEVDPGSGLPVFVYEADAALQFGGELAAQIRPFPDLSISAGADYVRGSRISGEPLPRIPPLRLSVAAAVDRHAWWAGARLRAVTAQDRVAPNEEPTSGYMLAGLEGGLRLGPSLEHVITLRLDNLLDVAYRDHLSRIEARDAPMPSRNLALTYRVMW